ncbi:hypothetical protein PALI_a0700 [Pseudoalteromonas aliena SW19]|uniref:Uncharacterized protein n=1 Tax=Pseudoalteromonas aliena SW19 TaxID=1314866 RepID=A0ABR9DYS2_9GAMM|nr:hypothetical protein [Pseudoalteromonas aliena SW19]
MQVINPTTKDQRALKIKSSAYSMLSFFGWDFTLLNFQ